jgi:hypothetical protein
MNAARIVSWAKQTHTNPPPLGPQKLKKKKKKKNRGFLKFGVGDGGVRPQRIKIQKCSLLLNKQDQS